MCRGVVGSEMVIGARYGPPPCLFQTRGGAPGPPMNLHAYSWGSQVAFIRRLDPPCIVRTVYGGSRGRPGTPRGDPALKMAPKSDFVRFWDPPWLT